MGEKTTELISRRVEEDEESVCSDRETKRKTTWTAQQGWKKEEWSTPEGARSSEATKEGLCTNWETQRKTTWTEAGE